MAVEGFSRRDAPSYSSEPPPIVSTPALCRRCLTSTNDLMIAKVSRLAGQRQSGLVCVVVRIARRPSDCVSLMRIIIDAEVVVTVAEERGPPSRGDATRSQFVGGRRHDLREEARPIGGMASGAVARGPPPASLAQAGTRYATALTPSAVTTRRTMTTSSEWPGRFAVKMTTPSYWNSPGRSQKRTCCGAASARNGWRRLKTTSEC